jgi:hypothetical protein
MLKIKLRIKENLGKNTQKNAFKQRLTGTKVMWEMYDEGRQGGQGVSEYEVNNKLIHLHL